MKLKEYQGKRLFEAYGISIPMGFVISKKSLDGDNNISQIHERLDFLKNDVVLKAQILESERKKGELIIESDDKEFAKNALSIFKKIEDNEILVEENIKVKKELFCSLSISEVDKAPVLTISEKNNISEQSKSLEKNKHCSKLIFNNLNNKNLKNFVKNFPVPNALMPIVFNMYKLMVEKDCTLVEINPLVVTNTNGEDRLVALDSNIIVDDNALFRQETFRKLKELNE